MPSSLLTGISGLVAHQRRLDVVANNLANLNTVAFKTQRTIFTDLLYQTVSPATNGNAAVVGGSNPSQIGSGVQTGQIAKNMAQGTLEGTGQGLDFAIQGEGFFALSDGTKDLYSRNGAFSLDEQGYLVDPSTGFFVQRMGVLGEGDETAPRFQEPGDFRIKVPIGANVLGKRSSNISIGGNLLANAEGPMTEVLSSLSPFASGGSPATAATLLNDLDSNITGYTTGDEIIIEGTNADGSPITVNFAVDGTTTLGDVVDAINTAAADSTTSIDAQGNMIITADNFGPASLSLQMSDAATNVGESDFGITNPLLLVDGSFGGSVQSTMQVYDLQGGAHNLTYEFVKQSDNAWSVEFSIDPSEGTVIDGSVTGLRFADDGTFLTSGELGIGDLNIEFEFDGIATRQQMTVDVSSLSQFATEFDVNDRQDGRPPGKLVGISVGADGSIEGVSTNGDKVPVAQVAIASFRNPNGLASEGNSYYTSSLNSGEAQLGIGGLGGRGTMAGGQLEQSNVDMALEFTQLIVAQRGFSANARTITVSNEMLQELTNVIR